MPAPIVSAWLFVKRAVSNALVKPTDRVALPAFSDITALSAYVDQNVIHGKDPLCGWFDVYTHPETVNHWVVHNLKKRRYGAGREWPLQLDSDDVAVFYCAGARAIPGVDGAQLVVFTSKGGGRYREEACLVSFKNGSGALLSARGVFDLTDAALWEAGDDLFERAALCLTRETKEPLSCAPIAYPFED